MVKSCNGGLTVNSTDSTAIMTSTHFTPQDASELARAMRAARNYQGGVLLTEKGGVTEPDDIEAVAKYRRLCTHLADAQPELLGYRSWGPDAEVLTAAEAVAIMDEVIRPLDEGQCWQRRGSSSSQNMVSGVPGTQRRTFGVELDCKYRVIERSEMPPLLAALGERLLKRCASSEWPFSRCADAAVLCGSGFEQAYVQRYVPGTSSATLGFHFDSFGSFGELIVGVTLVGSAHLLLRKCGPHQSGDFVKDPAATMDDTRSLCLPLAPLAAYALTGISRFDLKHAVVSDGSSERLSVTFRQVKWDRVRPQRPLRRRARELSPPSTSKRRACRDDSDDDADATKLQACIDAGVGGGITLLVEQNARDCSQEC